MQDNSHCMKPKLAARHPHLGLAIIVITAMIVTAHLMECPREVDPRIRTIVLITMPLGVCVVLAWCFWPVTRVESSLGLLFEEPTDKQKVVHVRIWTAL